MISSSPPRIPNSSSDFGFFSTSKTQHPVASTTSSVVVTTRITHKALPDPLHTSRTTSVRSLHQSSSPRHSLASSSFSESSTLPKKRKSLPATPTAGLSDLPPAVKRLRTVSCKEKSTTPSSSHTSSRATSHNDTVSSSPEPIYRSSRSRSTSLFPNPRDISPIQARQWGTRDDGDPGKHLSSETVVKKLMKSYKSYFKNPNDPKDRSFEPHPTNYPVVELEYPNSLAVERFILLAPKDKDHYNPIMDLEQTLYTIVECYVPKKYQYIFGPIPSDTLSEDDSPPVTAPSPSPPSSRSPPSSDISSSSMFGHKSASTSNTSLPSTSSKSPGVFDRLPLLRAVQRAINTQDGPLFMLAIKQVNQALHDLKYPELDPDPYAPAPPNRLLSSIESWTSTGLPDKVLMRIIDENYQRTVGPNVPSLKHYEAFSSTVYGELMPSLAQEMINITGLNQNSLFLDLGSGVGNVVVQASLQTGCKSYGIELLKHPARVARDVAEQIKIRCRMWGLSIGDIELEEGDMLESRRVDELIPKADVVLVDNKVFETSLNEALRPKFLDLKEGATVISLAPFVHSLNGRVTKRNVDDISSIFDVTERPYHSGSVSWGNSGGTYYLHKVDRRGYSKIKAQFETLHGKPARNSRSRR